MKNANHVAAFKAARKLIRRKEAKYICYAMEDAHAYGKITGRQQLDAKALISDLLGPLCTCAEQWIVRHVPNTTYDYLHNTEEMKFYRLRWLDALIAEFS